MPYLNLKISQPYSTALSQVATELLLSHTERILKKQRSVTAISIDFVPPEHWSIGGQTLRALGQNSVYFDIKVTDGTNTKDEKAQYIAECFSAFAELLGPLHATSYIFVHDVKAEAYGYGGQTQEWRYIQGKN
jgi:4-oxalocrotonate tautomerase